MPAPLAWPSNWGCEMQWNSSIDPTLAYAQLWRGIEAQACSWHAMHGVRVSPLQCGRAQTLATKPKVQRLVQCRKGRVGEVQPKFLGISLQHARYFKQLRRLQALKQLLASDTGPNAKGTIVATWKAIRHAVGFPGGFGPWWCRPSLRCCQRLAQQLTL